MDSEFREKMLEHIKRHEGSKIVGLSTRDVVAANYTDAEFGQLIDSLQQRPVDEWAAFRLESFVYEKQDERIPLHLRRIAASYIADLLYSNPDSFTSSLATLFLAWGKDGTDYKELSTSLLKHADAQVRQVALRYSPVFLPPSEYNRLLDFQRDPYVSEIAMSGPCRFILRDRALEILAGLTGFTVTKDDCFESSPEGPVYYYSWSPFLNWFAKSNFRKKLGL
jgi:hypothetical protein